VTDVGAADPQGCRPERFSCCGFASVQCSVFSRNKSLTEHLQVRSSVRSSLFAANGLLLRCLLFDLHLTQFVEFAIQAMPQRAFWTKLLKKGLGPRKYVLVDLLTAKKGSPRPLNFVFSKQSITS